MKIKNWSKFQHFKDRRPPWIKLYRDILDDIDWHQLDPLSTKVLVMCWLIASEDDGSLPDIKTLAFRLRMPEKQTSECISKLSHWLEQGDIAVISERYQDDAPETETETKKETEKKPPALGVRFDRFWKAYPKKVGKFDAQKSFEKRKVDDILLERMLKAIESQSQSDSWRKDNGQFIPNPSTWLNQGRWEDEGVTVASAPAINRGPDPALMKIEADRQKATPMPAHIRQQINSVLRKA